MVEDMGAAAPRFEMAHMLGVDERDVPTEAVHYDLPHGVWMPALLGEREDQPGAVLWENGRLYVWGEGQGAARVEVTLTLSKEEEQLGEEGEAYLGGRSTVRIRPTPAFYRPGVVVVAAAGAGVSQQQPPLLGVVGPFDPSDGRYPIHWQRPRPPHDDDDDDDDVSLSSSGGGGSARLTPYEVQAGVLRPDTELRCDVGCIREQRVELQRADGSVVRVAVGAAEAEANGDDDDAEPAGKAVCFLDYQGDGEEEEDRAEGGILGVRMPRLLPGGASSSYSAPGGLFGASHGARARRAYEERFAPRTRVHIDGVALPPSSSSAHHQRREQLFVRCRHLAGGGV
jgi:hypothetical protein